MSLTIRLLDLKSLCLKPGEVLSQFQEDIGKRGEQKEADRAQILDALDKTVVLDALNKNVILDSIDKKRDTVYA